VTPDQSKYFDDMEFMFGSQGWKNLIEDLQARQAQEKENLLISKATADAITQAFGRNEVYQYILSLESTLSEVKRQLVEGVYE
jgi:hypothetical protein